MVLNEVPSLGACAARMPDGSSPAAGHEPPHRDRPRTRRWLPARYGPRAERRPLSLRRHLTGCWRRGFRGCGGRGHAGSTPASPRSGRPDIVDLGKVGVACHDGSSFSYGCRSSLVEGGLAGSPAGETTRLGLPDPVPPCGYLCGTAHTPGQRPRAPLRTRTSLRDHFANHLPHRPGAGATVSQSRYARPLGHPARSPIRSSHSDGPIGGEA